MPNRLWPLSPPVSQHTRAGDPGWLDPLERIAALTQQHYDYLLHDALQAHAARALVSVTPNLGIVAKMCDKVAVMYAGKREKETRNP